MWRRFGLRSPATWSASSTGPHRSSRPEGIGACQPGNRRTQPRTARKHRGCRVGSGLPQTLKVLGRNVLSSISSNPRRARVIACHSEGDTDLRGVPAQTSLPVQDRQQVLAVEQTNVLQTTALEVPFSSVSYYDPFVAALARAGARRPRRPVQIVAGRSLPNRTSRKRCGYDGASSGPQMEFPAARPCRAPN